MKTTQTMKRIIAGVLIFVMLLLEVTTVFATENDTKNNHMQSIMKTQITYTLNNDLFNFPTTVPTLFGSTNKIYLNIVSKLEPRTIATYPSHDNLFSVTFENVTDKTIDINKAIVRSIKITPQIDTVLKISGLTISPDTFVSKTDLMQIFGPYEESSENVLSWDFDTYSISITLQNGCIENILLTSNETTLPNVSKSSFYNIESGEYYKIDVFENKQNFGAVFATSFYVTKTEKDKMDSQFFFNWFITNTYPMGYLKENETIDKLNIDNDYQTVLTELSEQNISNYYENNYSVISKSDYEIEKETNIRYMIICIILTIGTVALIAKERKRKKRSV